MSDTLSDTLEYRMKQYEHVETKRLLGVDGIIYARLDGRGFSKFTKDMRRPFDLRFTKVMQDTAVELVHEFNPSAVFTQSDEISLVWEKRGNSSSQFPFNGKVHKLTSVLASFATSVFIAAMYDSFDDAMERMNKHPHFDARVIEMPSRAEAVNMILWRQQDGIRNAVEMAARAKFSHKSLHKVNTGEMLVRLSDAGIQFETEYPPAVRLGSLLRRHTHERRLTDEEWYNIPAPYRQDREQTFIRTSVDISNPPRMSGIINRNAVIFEQADPEWYA